MIYLNLCFFVGVTDSFIAHLIFLTFLHSNIIKG